MNEVLAHEKSPLVICGDHDECDPSLSKEMHEKIASSKLVILPNSGHVAFQDQPGLWIGNVRDFINAGSRGTTLGNRSLSGQGPERRGAALETSGLLDWEGVYRVHRRKDVYGRGSP